ncbi:hypothetical protein VULLAG_LOCUS18432 [Vulpes lagopus]
MPAASCRTFAGARSRRSRWAGLLPAAASALGVRSAELELLAEPARCTGQRKKEIPWNETSGRSAFGRVSSEQMGQQQPESLLPLAESTTLDQNVFRNAYWITKH